MKSIKGLVSEYHLEKLAVWHKKPSVGTHFKYATLKLQISWKMPSKVRTKDGIVTDKVNDPVKSTQYQTV